MAYEALRHYARRDLTFRFVSNVDSTDFAEATRDLAADETLFIVSSKTFTTLETMTNACTAREWALAALGDESAIAKHFVAVSTNAEEVSKFGIDTDNMFGFWDWVGGRYSMDSAIGLSTMLAVGPDAFREMLAGFHEMDVHFRTTPFERNLPVLMGLLAVWYGDFFDAETVGVMPYEQYLKRFPAYLQQLTMESNGKHVTLDGRAGRLPDRRRVLGRAGHERPAQLLPADPPGHEADPGRLDRLRARRSTRSATTTTSSCPTCSRRRRRWPSARPKRRCARRVRPTRSCPTACSRATVPTNAILAERLTPHTLGTLVALYEHSVFTQGTIWSINSFDQWGVELGKVLAKRDHPRARGRGTSPSCGTTARRTR